MRYDRLGIALLLASLLAGCIGGTPKVQVSGTQGPLELLFRKDNSWYPDDSIYGPNRKSSDQGASIESIGLEHTSCYGYCPEFTVLYCRSGVARYCGRASVEPIGCFRGNITVDEFNVLAGAMADIGFFELSHSYATTVTDEASVLILGEREEETKIVKDYAESGPPRLWLLAYLLESIIDRIAWEPTSLESMTLTCSSAP